MSSRSSQIPALPAAWQACALAQPEPDKPPVASDGSERIPFESYYESQRKEFLLKTRRGVWLLLNETSFKRHLKAAGFASKPPEGEILSEVDHEILRVQNECDVDYSGPLCGEEEGFHQKGSTRILVTQSPVLVQPVPGKFPTITALIDGLLGGDPDHGPTQCDVMLSWMKLALTSLMARQIQAAQVVAIAGPPGCGKSLLQAFVTQLFGGRSAKPARYMSGGTEFNGELFGAEHLMLEDEFMSRKISDRLKLGASIKSMAVSRMQSCHCKGRQAITLPVWWRVTVSLNCEPEAMLVLPPLNEDVSDKIILLKAGRFEFPMPMGSADAQSKFMEQCREELPAFVDFLLNHYVIPAHLVESVRYGVVTWQHPQMKAELDNLSPEADLLAMIDQVLWTSRVEWRGTTEELQRILVDDAQTATQARRLLDYRNACGSYLGRLANKPNPRVREARTPTKREYIITAPTCGQ